MVQDTHLVPLLDSRLLLVRFQLNDFNSTPTGYRAKHDGDEFTYASLHTPVSERYSIGAGRIRTRRG